MSGARGSWAVLVLALGCSGPEEGPPPEREPPAERRHEDPPEQRTQEPQAAVSAQNLQALRAALQEEGSELVVYRIGPDYDGPMWSQDSYVERPAEEVPHRAGDEQLREALVAAVSPAALLGGERDLAGVEFRLEVLCDGDPWSRVDVHDVGGPASVFLVEHEEIRTELGYAQLALTEAGRRAWRAALEAAWERAEE